MGLQEQWDPWLGEPLKLWPSVFWREQLSSQPRQSKGIERPWVLGFKLLLAVSEAEPVPAGVSCSMRGWWGWRPLAGPTDRKRGWRWRSATLHQELGKRLPGRMCSMGSWNRLSLVTSGNGREKTFGRRKVCKDLSL